MDDKDETVGGMFEDDLFSIGVSGNMQLRNLLRAGLVTAQEKDRGKMPLLVSWPEWLEDGIVCLFASDFRDVLDRVVRETAESLMAELDSADDDGARDADDVSTPPVPKTPSFKPLDIGALPKAGPKDGA